MGCFFPNNVFPLSHEDVPSLVALPAPLSEEQQNAKSLEPPILELLPSMSEQAQPFPAYEEEVLSSHDETVVTYAPQNSSEIHSSASMPVLQELRSSPLTYTELTRAIQVSREQKAMKIRNEEQAMHITHWAYTWTVADDVELLTKIKEHEYNHWGTIQHSQHSLVDCQQRYWSMLSIISSTSFLWSSEEDFLLELLSQLHPEHEPVRWIRIGAEHPTRTDVECLERFIYLHNQANITKVVFLNYAKRYSFHSLAVHKVEQIRQHWIIYAINIPGQNVSQWTAEEDIELIENIALAKMLKIKEIAHSTRNRPECRKRKRALKKIQYDTNVAWSPKEDEMLQQCFQNTGPLCRKTGTYHPTRSIYLCQIRARNLTNIVQSTWEKYQY